MSIRQYAISVIIENVIQKIQNQRSSLIGIYFSKAIDKFLSARYNTIKPTSVVGLIHKRSANQNEELFS